MNRTLNLIQKGRTRRRVAVPGDLFSLHFPTLGWMYGLVARDDARVGSFGPLALVYIYDVISSKRLPVPKLSRERLVVPVKATNPTPWRTGKWEFIENIPLTEGLVYPRHSFYCHIFKKYYDEQSNEIVAGFEPCLLHAMANVTSIEYDIGCKLNLIPLDDR